MGSGNSSPAEAAGGWVQQSAGHGGDDIEEGAGQVPHHQLESDCITVLAMAVLRGGSWRGWWGVWAGCGPGSWGD